MRIYSFRKLNRDYYCKDLPYGMEDFGLSGGDIDSQGYITLYHGGKRLPRILRKGEIFFMTPYESEAEDYARMRHGEVFRIRVKPEDVRWNNGSMEVEFDEGGTIENRVLVVAKPNKKNKKNTALYSAGDIIERTDGRKGKIVSIDTDNSPICYEIQIENGWKNVWWTTEDIKEYGWHKVSSYHKLSGPQGGKLWEKDRETWEKAKDLWTGKNNPKTRRVKKLDMSNPNHWRQVTHLYKNLGGQLGPTKTKRPWDEGHTKTRAIPKKKSGRYYSAEFTKEDYAKFLKACGNNDAKIVSDYIDAGISPNIQYSRAALNWSALMLASDSGNTKIVQMLIDAGANPNIKSSGGLSALFFATSAEVFQILIDAGANINTQDSNGNTPLMYAADRGYKEIAKILIEAGADLNIQDRDGRTALIQAIYPKSVALLLVEARANLDIQDSNGRTALMYAAIYNDKEIVQMLIKAGANLDIQDRDGTTALKWAAYYDNIEIVQLLLKAGANTKLEDKGGKTFLQYISPENMHYFIKYFPIAMQIELALFSKNYNTLYSILQFIDKTISQSEYNQLIRSKRLEDKLRLIFAENVSKKTLYYFSSDKEVGWVAKERYKELRSKLGRRLGMRRYTNREVLSYLLSEFVFSFEFEALGKEGWTDKVVEYWSKYGVPVSEGDSSITGENAAEIKPAPMSFTPAHIKALYDFFDYLPSWGAKTNTSCGFHIHVSFPYFNELAASWIICNLAMDKNAEDMLFYFKDFEFFNDRYASSSYLNEIRNAIEHEDFTKLSRLLNDEKYVALRMHPIGTLEWRGPRNFLNKHNSDVNKDFIKLLWHYVFWLNDVLTNQNTITGTNITRSDFQLMIEPTYKVENNDMQNKQLPDSYKNQKDISAFINNLEGVVPDNILSKVVDTKSKKALEKVLYNFNATYNRKPVTLKDWQYIDKQFSRVI